LNIWLLLVGVREVPQEVRDRVLEVLEVQEDF
jgi:hypothetical protein